MVTGRETVVRIRAGYDIAFNCFQEVPMVLMLTVHPSRKADLLTDHSMRISPNVLAKDYTDVFGNVCTRLVAPAGRIEIRTEFVIKDSGLPDAVAPNAPQVPLHELPDSALMYLLGSRYCDTQKLSDLARSDRTASEGHQERIGVCRDFAHLAVALCRCVNIPARYCTGYLGDIGVPLDPAPMDFSAWFEAYIGGRWYTFDARHNHPRIGRIVIARGRDAADVAISTMFGPTELAHFSVLTEEILSDGTSRQPEMKSDRETGLVAV
jgi:hypothetical protein